jgi:hypothetical protein
LVSHPSRYTRKQRRRASERGGGGRRDQGTSTPTTKNDNKAARCRNTNPPPSIKHTASQDFVRFLTSPIFSQTCFPGHFERSSWIGQHRYFFVTEAPRFLVSVVPNLMPGAMSTRNMGSSRVNEKSREIKLMLPTASSIASSRSVPFPFIFDLTNLAFRLHYRTTKSRQEAVTAAANSRSDPGETHQCSSLV